MAILVLVSYCIPRNTGLHGRGRLLIRGCEVVTMLLGTRKQESVNYSCLEVSVWLGRCTDSTSHLKGGEE